MTSASRSMFTRRQMLRAAGAASLEARQAQGLVPRPEHGFGPLAATADETTGLPLLKLPRGFRYSSFAWTGDLMSDGTFTPGRHDGMAVVDLLFTRQRGPELVLIRNHERGVSQPGDPLPVVGAGQAPVYDDFTLPRVIAGIGGGTTALRYGLRGFMSSEATLAGTLGNCAGGRTTWGSWLTCEETMVRGSALGAADHGYVFEVPAPNRARATAVPLKDMGFMPHEAAAVDPKTGNVYLTEDNSSNSGMYRFVPNARPRRIGDLERGGRLEMLKVLGASNADLRAAEQGASFDVEWVPIAEPNADPEAFVPPLPNFPPIAGVGRSGPYLQGEALGGARFARGEGCWYQDGTVYFIDTVGGAAGKRVVWALELPEHERSGFGGVLTALFVSPSEEVADNPDNITLSPLGGVLFVNIQTPGVTFAIEGPWWRAGL